MLKGEGYILGEDKIEMGEWKIYDSKKGYLKKKGNYYQSRREGLWLEYRKNGKVKKQTEYLHGKEINAKKK